MAAKANLSVVQGDTFSKSATYRLKTGSVPINLTGGSVSGKITKGGVVTNLVCAVTSAAAGQFTFGLSALTTAGLDAGVYTYDVQVNFSDSTVKTVLAGNLVVTKQV